MIRLVTVMQTHPRLSRLSAWMERLPVLGRYWRDLLANPKRIERFVKFAIVGAIGAVVDFVVLNIMKFLFESIGLGIGWGLSVEPHQIQLVVCAMLAARYERQAIRDAASTS